jgi:hypothetical protein
VFNILIHNGNARQNYTEIPSPMSKWLSSRKQITNAVQDANEKECLYTVGRDVNFCASMEISKESLQKQKIQIPKYPAMPFLGIHPKEYKSTDNRGICTTFMFIAALLTTAKL